MAGGNQEQSREALRALKEICHKDKCLLSLIVIYCFDFDVDCEAALLASLREQLYLRFGLLITGLSMVFFKTGSQII